MKKILFVLFFSVFCLGFIAQVSAECYNCTKFLDRTIYQYEVTGKMGVSQEISEGQILIMPFMDQSNLEVGLNYNYGKDKDCASDELECYGGFEVGTRIKTTQFAVRENLGQIAGVNAYHYNVIVTDVKFHESMPRVTATVKAEKVDVPYVQLNEGDKHVLVIPGQQTLFNSMLCTYYGLTDDGYVLMDCATYGEIIHFKEYVAGLVVPGQHNVCIDDLCLNIEAGSEIGPKVKSGYFVAEMGYPVYVTPFIKSSPIVTSVANTSENAEENLTNDDVIVSEIELQAETTSVNIPVEQVENQSLQTFGESDIVEPKQGFFKRIFSWFGRVFR